jgi:hypothetical protein
MHRCALHSALIAKGNGMMHARASKRDAHRPKPNPVDVVEVSGMRETLLAAALAAICAFQRRRPAVPGEGDHLFQLKATG